MTVNTCMDLIFEEKSFMMGSTAESQIQDLNTGSLCSAPGLREISKITQTVPVSPCSKAFLFSLSSLQTIMEPAILQFSTNPSRYKFCISSFYHHNPLPSWKVSPENLHITSAFQSGHSSVPEDNGQWDILLHSVPVLHGRAVCSQQPAAQSCQGMITVTSIWVQNHS